MMLKTKWILLAFVFGLFIKSEALKIAVIGAGAAGLASAKNAHKQGHKVVIYEMGEALGGVWYFTENAGKDKYGVNIQTPMYQGLRTNTPYQTMEFPDFRFKNGTQTYPRHDVIWNYLDSYAKHFGIKKLIKYHHLVDNIRSIQGEKWEITVRNTTLRNNHCKTDTFDAVFVCTGANALPCIPALQGAENFKGKVMHSRDYRRPDGFYGNTVLIVGGGPSGNDIFNQLSMYAYRVTFSYHKPTIKKPQMLIAEEPVSEFDNDNPYKGDVKCFLPNGFDVQFEDGTNQSFSTVIYATGYKYSYSFLDANVGIEVKDNYVGPLYKQILNIRHPTMAFVGVPFIAAHNPMYDLQARFALKFISRGKKLPSYEKMLEDMQMQAEIRVKDGRPKDKPHYLGQSHKKYYADLAKTAGIKNVPDVISNIFADAIVNSKLTREFRNNNYIISDDMKTFKRVPY